MKRNRFVALVVSAAALGVGAGPAMADAPASGQVSEQTAANEQSAQSGATSTQYGPSNTNISVRVLSPGDNGSVTQRNTSTAESGAANGNSTAQAVEQRQAGSGGAAVQEAGQKAVNDQSADSRADSTQVKPTNRNISVRVLSPGDDGDVSQSNESAAKSYAVNENRLGQAIRQAQDGSRCCSHEEHGDRKDSDPKCCVGSVGIQAAGQHAYSTQDAESSAESKQYKPENNALSVRVLSKGDDGDVTQSNESVALSKALNANRTAQAIDQSQDGSSCRCHGGLGIQAAGQAARNYQDADSWADSKQVYPENKSLALRFASYGGGGDLTQSNASGAASFAANYNALEQALAQAQGVVRR